METEQPFVLLDFDKFKSTSECIINKYGILDVHIIEQKIIEANYYISRQLDVPLATKLFYLCRLRSVNGIPVSIDKNYIQFDKVRGLENFDFTNVSFYSILNKEMNIEIKRTEQEILILEANEHEKELLCLDQNEIVLIKGTGYREDTSRPLDYFEMAAVPTFYHFRSVTNP